MELASERPAFCSRCGARAGEEDRHCTTCGRRLVLEGAGGPDARLGWIFAAILLLGLGVTLALPRLFPVAALRAAPGPEPVPESALGPSAVDLSGMSALDAADRLFVRVMNALDTEDEAEFRNFLPMAIGAYELARPLEAAPAFRLALLQYSGLNYEGALAAAREGLADVEGHLLNLAIAANAAAALGDEPTALEYHQAFLAGFDTERATGRPEYEAFSEILESMKAEAERFMSARVSLGG